MTIIAAADGSALGNPGPMGWAWYIDDANWAAGGAPHGTNNQGELMAVLELLRATKHTDDDMLVHCDSKYVIDSLTTWLPGWKRRGWRKADGKPVLNREIMEALDLELDGRDVRFDWVKGHAGHPLNEAADERANQAAQAFGRRARVAEGPGFSGGGAADAAPAETPAPRRGRVPASRVSRVSRVSLRDHAAGGAVGLAQPTLFDALDDARTSDADEIRIALTARERARLRTRAEESGLSPEDFLRSLI